MDTSVWIRFLAGREPYASTLDRLLSRDEVLSHEFVFGELLIGDRGGRRELLETYLMMRPALVVANSEVVEFVRHRKLNGLGVGWIDVHLLASAVVTHSYLWTADHSLRVLAGDLGVAYRF